MTLPELTLRTQAPTDRIAGWMPAGMLDWPGRLSATVFLAGCSLRCPFCHNPGLLSSNAACTEWSDLESYLQSKRDWLDGVVVTGGEPTDDPSLAALLEAFAELGYQVKLDTNGTNPDTLETLLTLGLVSHVALDIKTTLDRYDALVDRPGTAMRVERAITLLRRSGVSHEFRTTAYPGALAIDDFLTIASMLRGGDLYAIQQFVPDTTLDPRASAVLPFRPDALHDTAAQCNRHLPTIVRGV
ncbi:MAG: anaerobic ribonucleoside-triphosphate reductase activating protein [Coriobacteriia bacterium]|nr:anaerobic ribonucleoside-triphosphate reductase activating protein [Coriobacteriia bacterium]